MSKVRRRLAVAMIAVVAVCLTGGVLIWRVVLADKVLAEIRLPSGDTVEIIYRTPNRLLFALAGVGGLRYHICYRSGEMSGLLTTPACYDYATDVQLTYEITGDRSVNLHARQHAGWIISGNASGQYEIIDLSPDKPDLRE